MTLPPEMLKLLVESSGLSEEQVLESIKRFEDDPRPLWCKITQPLHSGQCKTISIVESITKSLSQPLLIKEFSGLISGWKENQ